MTRRAVADELQRLIGQLQQLNAEAESLARSSGLIDPKWFGGARTAYSMAAGDLDQKGLWDSPPPAPVATEAEPT